MSELVMQELPIRVKIGWTAKIVSSRDGGYVGFMQEIPIVVQADTMEEVSVRMNECLSEYVEHESFEAIPHSMIKT